MRYHKLRKIYGRKILMLKNKASSIIQKYFKGYQIKKKYIILRNKVRSMNQLKLHRNVMAIKIQKTFRMH